VINDEKLFRNISSRTFTNIDDLLRRPTILITSPPLHRHPGARM
jgi:hypothetical protein